MRPGVDARRDPRPSPWARARTRSTALDRAPRAREREVFTAMRRDGDARVRRDARDADARTRRNVTCRRWRRARAPGSNGRAGGTFLAGKAMTR